MNKKSHVKKCAPYSRCLLRIVVTLQNSTQRRGNMRGFFSSLHFLCSPHVCYKRWSAIQNRGFSFFPFHFFIAFFKSSKVILNFWRQHLSRKELKISNCGFGNYENNKKKLISIQYKCYNLSRVNLLLNKSQPKATS